MKKFFAIVFYPLFFIATLFAHVNSQEIYPVGSEVFEAIKYLYVITGKALPSTTGPWSGAELQLMLSKINSPSLPEGAKAVYDFASEILNRSSKSLSLQDLGFTFGLQLNPEFYLHSNKDDAFQGRDNWNFGIMEQGQFLNFTWETWAAKNFYGYFELPIRNNFNLEIPFGSSKFSWDIPMLSSFKLSMFELDFNVPYRAFVSLGGKNWSLQAGRDRLSWGAGETGNMVISNNIPYHNTVRFTTFFSKYKFTLLTSFFPHPINYCAGNDRPGGTWGKGRQKAPDKGIRFYLAHRMEGRFFRDKLNLTLTEAIMYMSEDGHVDPRVLNPAAIFHDYYIRSNANSTLAIEADFTVAKGINIYGQLLVDEFALPGEPYGPDATSQFPTALGYLIGTKGYFSVGNGILHSSLEFAFTDPFLYLRDGIEDSGRNDHNNNTRRGDYSIDYVVAMRTFTSWEPLDNVTYDEYFLGYKYGGDAIVTNLNLGWKVFGSFAVEGNFFWMRHGTFDKWTRWSRVGTKEGLVKWDDAKTPTTTHQNTVNNKDNNPSNRNSASDTIVVGIHASYDIFKNLKVFAQADFININNYANIRGNKEKDFQVVVGLSYSL